jgi:transposase
MAVASLPEVLAENQQLRQLVAEQQRTIEHLQRTIEQLQHTIRQLQERLDAAERGGKRQAAPFSEGPPKKRPKTPGRKSGNQHGRHEHRALPPPEQIAETLEARLPTHCPDCHGPVQETHVDKQFQTEIPREPIVRQFNIHCGCCQDCGKTVRGRHPQQTSAATGAAQSQVGPDAQAAVVYLNKHAGLSYGKIRQVFDRLFGITLSRGACAQIVLRAGRRLEPVYQTLRQHLKDVAHLTPDETGWRVGGRSAWLHAWVAGDGTTCYAIDTRRSAAVLQEVIGRAWSGFMTHDGCASYDRQFPQAIHQQCVDHALRRARALREQHTGRARAFPSQVLKLLRGALKVRDRHRAGQLDDAALDRAQQQCVQQLLDLTRRPRRNAANATFAKHLHKHGEQWLMFLIDPRIPATNHRAEQALKTPIVNRKVWGGNRTAVGAHAQEVTASVLQTCKNKAADALTYISNAFRGLHGNLCQPLARPPTA